MLNDWMRDVAEDQVVFPVHFQQDHVSFVLHHQLLSGRRRSDAGKARGFPLPTCPRKEQQFKKKPAGLKDFPFYQTP